MTIQTYERTSRKTAQPQKVARGPSACEKARVAIQQPAERKRYPCEHHQDRTQGTCRHRLKPQREDRYEAKGHLSKPYLYPFEDEFSAYLRQSQKPQSRQYASERRRLRTFSPRSCTIRKGANQSPGHRPK